MQLSEQVLGIFLVLCRIGACLIVVPGVSSARIPVRVRLYLAVALALVVGPLVNTGQFDRVAPGPAFFPLIVGECLTGAAIGFLTRLFIEALQFAATCISHYIGLNGMSAGIETSEAEPSLTSLIGISGTMMLLILDLPAHVVVSLVDSFSDLPLGAIPGPKELLEQFTSVLAVAFMIGLRLTAPFLVYAVIVNAMFGILGKLVPQIQSYFLSTPFLALGGLFLLYLAIGEILDIFSVVVSAELQRL